MKRPNKAVIYLDVESKPSNHVDWNGKTTRDYFVRIPFWLVRAYRLTRKKVRVSFVAKGLSYQGYQEMNDNERLSRLRAYFRKNWYAKINKMRIRNHNYISIVKVEEIVKESPCEKCECPTKELAVKSCGNLAKLKCQDICPDYEEYLSLKRYLNDGKR